MKLYGIYLILYSEMLLFCDSAISVPKFHGPQTDTAGGQYMVVENVVVANMTVAFGTYTVSVVNIALLVPSTGADSQTCQLDWLNTTFRALEASKLSTGNITITVGITEANSTATHDWNGITNASGLSGITLSGDLGAVTWNLVLRTPAEFAIHVSGYNYLEFISPNNCSDSTPVYNVAIGSTRGVKATFVHPMPEREEQLASTCRSEVDNNGIRWWTASPSSSVILSNACPPTYTGTVYRHCSAAAVWQPPVLNCTAPTLTRIQDEIKSGSSNVSCVLHELASLIDQPNATRQGLLVGDISTTTDILKDVVYTVAASNDTVEHEEITDFLTTAGNLMNESIKPSWRTILHESGSGIDTLLVDIERFFDLVAITRNESTYTQNYTAPNLYVETGRIIGNDIDVTFRKSITAKSPALADGSVNGIDLPVSSDMLGLSYTGILYDDLRDRLLQKFKKRDPATFLNSPIMALTLTPRLGKPLSKPVTLTFKLFERSPLQPRCSFWKQGSRGGWWATDGCTLDNYSVEDLTVVCKCTHLTNFAILMSQAPAPAKHEKVLGVISMVGCITSMLCLVLTFAIYVSNWRHVKSERAVLLLNLCASLFLAYLGFLLGVDRVADKNVCTAIAAILQFLYLTVFFIMLSKSVYLAKMCLLPTNKTPIAKWCLLAAYGCAAVVVGVSLGVTKLHGYGTHTTCWLSIGSGLFWAFAGPALFVMLVNAVIVVIVLKVKFSTVYMVKKRTREKISSGLRNILVLLPIMGLTWVFGVFSVNEETVAFQYVFAVCNSMQGFLVFVFHCLLDHKVKLAVTRAIRRKLRKARPEALYSANKQASIDTSKSQESSLAHAASHAKETT